MKTLLVALVLATSLAGVAARADSSCQAKAADKKLHGAAETSFVKKCEKDSKAASAAETCKTAPPLAALLASRPPSSSARCSRPMRDAGSICDGSMPVAFV